MGLGDAVDKAGQAIGLPSTEAALEKNRQSNAHSQYAPGTAGDIIGSIVATLPTLAAGPFAGGAAAGALTAPTDSSPLGYAGHATFGGATGWGLGKLFSGLAASTAAKEAIPTLPELEAAKDAAYQVFDQSGHMVNAPAFRGFVGDLRTRLADEAMDGTLHPQATAAFNKMAADTGNNVTFKGMDVFRKAAGAAGGSQLPADQRLAGIIKSSLDDFMNNLTPENLVLGQGVGDPAEAVAALNAGRQANARLAQTETIADLFRRASIKEPVTGMENGLRQEFRSLALNDRDFARLGPEVQTAVETVAKGTPIGNAARLVGKAAPRGIVSGILAPGAGVAAAGPAGLAIPAIGEIGKAIATRTTKNAAKKALETAALGRAPVTTPTALSELFRQLGRGAPVAVSATQGARQ
jgi:hypothetical protein